MNKNQQKGPQTNKAHSINITQITTKKKTEKRQPTVASHNKNYNKAHKPKQIQRDVGKGGQRWIHY